MVLRPDAKQCDFGWKLQSRGAQTRENLDISTSLILGDADVMVQSPELSRWPMAEKLGRSGYALR